MEQLNFIQHFTQRPIDMTGARAFGEPGHVNPEGVYLTGIHACGFLPTKASIDGKNNDRLLVFQLRSIEPGFEGIEFERVQITFPEGELTAPQGADTKTQQKYRIARDKVFAALLSVGYTEQQVQQFFAQGARLDHTNVVQLFQTGAPGQGRMVIKIVHDLDVSNDPATNYTTALKLRNGQDKHRVIEEYYWLSLSEYAAGKLASDKPNRLVKSAKQQQVEQENAIGLATGANVPAPSAGNFQPAVQTIAQPTPGAVPGPGAAAMASVPTTPAVANPFGATVSVPTAAPAPGYAATPNGNGALPLPGAAPAPSLTGALPPAR